MGITPNIIVLRCDEPLEPDIFKKIAMFCNVKPDCVIENMADSAFGLTPEELDKLTDPATFTGMAEHQTEKFLREDVAPVLEAHKAELGAKIGINV